MFFWSYGCSGVIRRNACALAAGGMLAGLLLAAGCGEKKNITIGYVGGLTGRHYNLGVSGRNGAELAVDDLNRSGGINGRTVELVVRDDRQDADTARAVDRELIGRGIPVIIGHMTSSMSASALPLIVQADVLMISPTSSDDRFAGRDDRFIMLYPTNRTSGSYLADYAFRKQGVRDAVIFSDVSNKTFSEGWADAFKRSFLEKGGRISGMYPFESARKPVFADLVAGALSRRPDAVVIVAGALDTAMICQQVRKIDRRVRLFSSDWGGTSDLIKYGGPAVEGIVFPLKINPEDESPRFLAFRKRYEERFGRSPDFAAVTTYEAVMVAAAGFRKAGDADGIKRAIIRQKTFEGLQGQIVIDENGDAFREQHIITVSEGRFVHVE